MATENEPTLADIADRLGSIDNRLDGIDNRLDGIDNRLDGMATATDMARRFNGLNTRMEHERKRSDAQQEQTLAAIHDATQGINHRINTAERNLADRVTDAETSISEALDAHARDPLAHQ